MAISDLNGWIGSTKQIVPMNKLTARTSVANISFSMFDISGSIGGYMNTSTTANGSVPSGSMIGYPNLNTFGGGGNGYISRVWFSNTVVSRITLYDRLFLAGAYAFNANTTLLSQPDFSARIPGGTDYKGLELWIEAATAFTNNQSIAVTYQNENGAGDGTRTTGTIATGVAPIIGRCLQLPLQTGDRGISKILSVTSTVSTVGTFNVMILRPLWSGRVLTANDGYLDDMLKTGLPEIFQGTALYSLVAADSTSTGLPNLYVDIVSG